MEPLDPSKLSDRELLLIVHERQSVMGLDVKEMKDGTNKELATLTAKVDVLEKTKADLVVTDALQRGQNRLFNYLWFAWGAMAVLEIGIGIYLSLRK